MSEPSDQLLPHDRLRLSTSCAGEIAVTGWLDLAGSRVLRRELAAVAVPAGSVLTIDLTGAVQLQSPAVAVLFQVAVERGLRLRVRDGTAIASTVRITRLAEVAEVEVLPPPQHPSG